MSFLNSPGPAVAYWHLMPGNCHGFRERSKIVELYPAYLRMPRMPTEVNERRKATTMAIPPRDFLRGRLGLPAETKRAVPPGIAAGIDQAEPQQ